MEMSGRFLKDPDERVAIITGYAGTGKTTLIGQLRKAYGMPTVLTPTGKASQRVSEATGLYASTIHRWLYKPETDPKTGAPIFTLKDVWEIQDMAGKYLLIDEASMVGKDVWIDLNAMSKQCDFKIILMGDLFQLPPVNKGPKDAKDNDFNALLWKTPYNVNLTEVHRQALDSPIIRASMMLRGNSPEFSAMGLLTAIGATKLIETALESRTRGGAIICHTNNRRHTLNNQIRQALGYQPGTLEPKEPLLVTQNNYAIDRYNGEVVDFRNWEVQPELAQIVSDRYTNSSIEMLFGIGEMEGFVPNLPARVMLSPKEISGATAGSNVGNWAMKKYSSIAYEASGGIRDEAPPYVHASYGYALTCHKSQGSEWPEVLVVIEDSLGRIRGIEKKRWLYTAITRAKTLCRYVYVKD